MYSTLLESMVEANRRAYNSTVLVLAALGAASLVILILVCWWRERHWKTSTMTTMTLLTTKKDTGCKAFEDGPLECDQVRCYLQFSPQSPYSQVELHLISFVQEKGDDSDDGDDDNNEKEIPINGSSVVTEV